MLEDRKIEIWSYNIETIIAEKFESIVKRGVLGTRVRDYYDVYMLLNTQSKNIDFEILKSAIYSTAEHRNTTEIIKEEEDIITGIVDNGDGSISYYDHGVLKTVDFCKVENGSYYTGFYFAPSGNTITARMKAGWNLRFTNLPNGSTYTFNEVLSYVLGNGIKVSDAFDFVEVELNVIKKDNDKNIISNSTGTISTTNTLVNNYKIDEYNTQYTIIYTNSVLTINSI